MKKLLEKAIRDEMKEGNAVIGTKQVLNSFKNSKLIVLSESVPEDLKKLIQEKAKKEKISSLPFEGTSVALGKLCGLQFRAAAISLSSVSDASIKSILKESKKEI